MSELTVRKVENGYVISSFDEDSSYEGIAASDKDMIDHVTEYFFGGVLDIAEAPSPEQPSYKHPEKDIFNLSEDEDSTEMMLSDSFPNAAGGVTERKVFKDGSASIKSTDAAGGSVTLKSDPITPMADLSVDELLDDRPGLPLRCTGLAEGASLNGADPTDAASGLVAAAAIGVALGSAE